MSLKQKNAQQRNLKLTIEYDGTGYCGWQIQKICKLQGVSRKSIQETIEQVLSKILQEKIKLTASGRTDAGVHAVAQIANFKTLSNIPAVKLQKALNSLLPEDITIKKIEEAGIDFHSRFHANSKIYRYLILNQAYPSALLKGKVLFYRHPLDVKLMRQEAKFLLGKHDFKAFCSTGSSAKSTIRAIKNISISAKFSAPCIVAGTLITVEIEADGFLYNMARGIVGTLLDIGRGRFKRGQIIKVLASRERKYCGTLAAAHGLYLVKVKY